jgi:hypothetical protein
MTLAAAFLAPVTPERGIGCGRIYVSVGGEHAKEVAKAAKALGKKFQKRSHYGTANALYVGYDNCDGEALARGSAIVAALKAAGVDAFRDEHGD